MGPENHVRRLNIILTATGRDWRGLYGEITGCNLHFKKISLSRVVGSRDARALSWQFPQLRIEREEAWTGAAEAAVLSSHVQGVSHGI